MMDYQIEYGLTLCDFDFILDQSISYANNNISIELQDLSNNQYKRLLKHFVFQEILEKHIKNKGNLIFYANNDEDCWLNFKNTLIREATMHLNAVFIRNSLKIHEFCDNFTQNDGKTVEQYTLARQTMLRFKVNPIKINQMRNFCHKTGLFGIVRGYFDKLDDKTRLIS